MFNLEIFFSILTSFFSVIVGFLAGRINKISRDNISKIIFYYLSPITFFVAPLQSDFNLNTLSITFVILIVGTLISIVTYFVLKFFWQDFNRNILAFASGFGNVGAFLLPAAVSMFDEKVFGLYLMGAVGNILYESSVGFFICSIHLQSPYKTLIKVLKVPTLIAFTIGCILASLGLHLPHFIDNFVNNIRSTYSVLGMSIVGLSLSTITRLKIDRKFLSTALISKFLVYPAVIIIFIILDKLFFHWYNNNVYKVILLISLAPISPNTIVFSSILNIDSEKITTAVLISTLIALIYIPVVINII